MFIILAFLVSCIVQSLYVHGILLEPEQIHLAVGRTPDYMAVQWAVIDEFCTTGTYVQYGLSSDALTNQVYGLCYPFDLNSQKIQKQSNHVAYMTNLKPSTKYFYRVGDLTRWSQIYSFKSLPDATTISNNLPQRFLIFGDLAGSNQAPSDSCTTMPWMSVEAANGDVDMTLQLGDLAYDLNTDGGLVGRQFMNEIQNMSAIVPFMIAHGNHESAFNYAYSTEFFRSHPSNLIDQTVTTFAGSAPNNWYYSFNVGLIHFVVVQVELILGNSNIVPSQWNWLKQDLEIANNNRTQAPWIIVSGHRSLYCSSDNDCNGDAFKLRQGIKQANGTYLYGLEDLFYTYGVDMYFNGHEHNYEVSTIVFIFITMNHLVLIRECMMSLQRKMEIGLQVILRNQLLIHQQQLILYMEVLVMQRIIKNLN